MILAAAILKDGVVHTLPIPARHHDIIFRLADLGYPTPVTGKQGFLDSSRGFVDRKKAAKIAAECGQLSKPLIAPPNLFSEDLW